MNATLRPVLLIVGALSLGGVVWNNAAAHPSLSSRAGEVELGGKDGGSIELGGKEGGSIELGGKEGGSIYLAGKDVGSPGTELEFAL